MWLRPSKATAISNGGDYMVYHWLVEHPLGDLSDDARWKGSPGSIDALCSCSHLSQEHKQEDL